MHMQAGNILAGRSRLIANCLGYSSNATDTTVAENLANARLIAAAPDLLEAAKAAVARQVINNWVTAGEWVCRNCGEMPSEHAHDEGCWVALCNAAIAKAEGVE